MKKILIGLLIALAAIGMVFAQAESEGMTAAASKTVIKFAAQGDSTVATQEVIDAFNASQDKYTAEWVDMSNDSGAMREQLTTSLKAGSSDYDVISMDVVWAGEFAASGYIEPLDARLKADGLKISDYNAGSMASGNYNAKQYVLPFFPDLGFLYFRSDIVSAADATKLRSGNYTWDDLYNMAAKYKGQKDTTDGIVFQAKLYEGLICNANEFTANWTDTANGLTVMKKFCDSDVTPADILNYTEGETHNSFIQGKSVFARNWPYQWGMLMDDGSTVSKTQVDAAPLPYGGTVGGWLLGINKNTAHEDGAWALLKFITGSEGQTILSTDGGYLPGFNSLVSNTDVLAANQLLTKEGFQMALTHTIARPVTPTYSKVSDSLQQAIHKYLSGSAKLDATVAAVNAALVD